MKDFIQGLISYIRNVVKMHPQKTYEEVKELATQLDNDNNDVVPTVNYSTTTIDPEVERLQQELTALKLMEKQQSSNPMIEQLHNKVNQLKQRLQSNRLDVWCPPPCNQQGHLHNEHMDEVLELWCEICETDTHNTTDCYHNPQIHRGGFGGGHGGGRTLYYQRATDTSRQQYKQYKNATKSIRCHLCL